MPYISQDKRNVLNQAIDSVHHAIVELELDQDGNNTQGNLNYAITRLLRMVYGDDGGYQNINDVIGLLECIKMEHYRTVAVPYEEQKRYDNGDIDSNKEPVFLTETVVSDIVYDDRD